MENSNKSQIIIYKPGEFYHIWECEVQFKKGWAS